MGRPAVTNFDPVKLIEAAYAVELPEPQWLAALAEAARTTLGQRNIGGYAITYDASDVNACEFGEFVSSQIRSRSLLQLLRDDFPAAYRAEPQVVDAVFRKTPFGPGQRLPLSGRMIAAREELVKRGAADVLGLNGINADGRGVHVGVLLPELSTDALPPELLARLASHLGASYRLRQKLHAATPLDHADAVLAVDGRVEHAKGAAKLTEVRTMLGEAVLKIERLRGPTRKRDPGRAVAEWKALVDARWSLVDHFERDGRRFLLAQRNDRALAPLAVLTERELQVVGLAAMGYANKMIGYELGISVSTAGVLLSRAAKKVGVRTRGELVKAYEAHVTRRRPNAKNTKSR